MANLTAGWTSELPLTEGYYWWRDPKRRRRDVVSVWLQNYWEPGCESQLLCRRGDITRPVQEMGGEWWSVRLVEPE